jgi:Activator of Hsp90 ATPase homolog 1-like protein
MTEHSYTTTLSINASPDAVFAGITNPRGWWSESIVGATDTLGGEFEYRYKNLHRSTQRITELVPGAKVVWHVADAALSFVANKGEWTGTDIVFEVAPKSGKTELRFTHRGLVPTCECYGDCSGAWGSYLASLRDLITCGAGKPDPRE